MHNKSYVIQSNQKCNYNISRNNKKRRKQNKKKGIRKTISVIAILTMTFQMGMPLVPGLTSKVFATNTTIPVATEKLQSTVSEDATTGLSESTDTEQTEEISRNYEIKDEETWDVSANGDGSVIAKWTLGDRTLTI